MSALVTFPSASESKNKGLLQSNPQLRAWAESVIRPENAPLHIISSATPEQLERYRSVRWYIDCGDDDYLYEGNLELYKLLLQKKIPMQYRMRDGAHNWLYWQSSLPEVMTFISIGFKHN